MKNSVAIPMLLLLQAGCYLVDNPLAAEAAGIDDVKASDSGDPGDDPVDPDDDPVDPEEEACDGTGGQPEDAGEADSSSVEGSESDDGSIPSSTGPETTGDTGDTGDDPDVMVWCADLDGDTFGDPDNCQMSDVQPQGMVANSDDCNDSDANTYLGAAWIQAPEACMTDADGDGWGDARPAQGAEPGGDCYDNNPDLNPDELVLTAFRRNSTTLSVVDPNTGSLDPFVTLDLSLLDPSNMDAVTATINDQGEILVNNNDNDRLLSLDYTNTCSDPHPKATATPLEVRHGQSVVCGLEWGPGGRLYGIEQITDELIVFDANTGGILDDSADESALPIMYEGERLNIEGCGSAYDCTQDRLLVANGLDGHIYAIDVESGEAELLLDISEDHRGFSPGGLEYDPVEQQVYISIGYALLRGEIDGSDDFEKIASFIDFGEDDGLSSLQYLPQCG